MKRGIALAALVLLAAWLGFLLSGCGSEGPVSLGPPPKETNTTSGVAPPPSGRGSNQSGGKHRKSLSLEVWFVRDGKLVVERRSHRMTVNVATAALGELLSGPGRGSGLATAIPDGTRLLGISIKNGVATVDLTSDYQAGGGSRSMQLRLGQVVYTLTQFPTVRTVRFQLDGAPVNVFSSEGIVLDKPVGRGAYKNLLSAGTWKQLPAASVAADTNVTAVWTGKQMIVTGVSGVAPDGNFLQSFNVALAYDPAAGTWTRLAAPPGHSDYLERHTAVWTDKEMLVWGFGKAAFDPETNRWRPLGAPPTQGGAGIVVWTGRELIGWGGGCCGDAFGDGSTYNAKAKTWRKLSPSPLAPSQDPIGAWTGRELIILVSGSAAGEPVKGARAGAYDPATDTWRRLAPMPSVRNGASAVWDGRELLVVGGTGPAHGAKPPGPATVGFAYNPATNHWRRLPRMESGRYGAQAVWTGSRLLVWGGQTGHAGSKAPRTGLEYDPKSNRWSALPAAPPSLLKHADPAVAWTGRELLVWGGWTGRPPYRGFKDGAAFVPTTP